MIDANDTFDPASVAAADADTGKILWVRCGGHLERALKAAHLLVEGGGFGVVALDLADIAMEIDA